MWQLHHRQSNPSASLMSCKHTVASVGDHCRSSTDLLWELNGRWSICHEVPPSRGSHTWMFFLQSPLTRRPVEECNNYMLALASKQTNTHTHFSFYLFCCSVAASPTQWATSCPDESPSLKFHTLFVPLFFPFVAVHVEPVLLCCYPLHCSGPFFPPPSHTGAKTSKCFVSGSKCLKMFGQHCTDELKQSASIDTVTRTIWFAGLSRKNILTLFQRVRQGPREDNDAVNRTGFSCRGHVHIFSPHIFVAAWG